MKLIYLYCGKYICRREGSRTGHAGRQRAQGMLNVFNLTLPRSILMRNDNMDVQQMLRNLRKEVECPLCLETVNEPKTLPCLHSFCLSCLDKHAAYTRRQLETAIKCPVCLTCFQIPEEDTFSGLPTSFHLNRLVDLLALNDGSTESQRCNNCDENSAATCYCFECQNFLCAACFEAHQRLKGTRVHRSILMANLQAQDIQDLIHRPVMCSQRYHEDQPLEYYCQECKSCICLKCSVVNHSRHKMLDIQQAADKEKLQMADVLENVEAEIVFYEKEMKKAADLIHKSEREITAAQRKMTESVDNRIRELMAYKTSMNAKLDEISQAQKQAYQTETGKFQVSVNQMKTFVEQGKDILQRSINAEILETNQLIIGRGEELLNARKPDIYKPPHVHYMRLVDNQSDVIVSPTDPSNSVVEGSRVLEAKTESSFTIVTRDSDGIQCYHRDDHIKAEVQTPAGQKLATNVQDSKDGKYTVTYTTDRVGQYKVGIEVNGQPLTGSQWSVQVVPQKAGFSDILKIPGQLYRGKKTIKTKRKTGAIAMAELNN